MRNPVQQTPLSISVRSEEGRGRSSPSCARPPEKDEQGSWEGKPALDFLQPLELNPDRLLHPSDSLPDPDGASIEVNSLLGQDLWQRPDRVDRRGVLGKVRTS